MVFIPALIIGAFAYYVGRVNHLKGNGLRAAGWWAATVIFLALAAASAISPRF